VLKYIRLLSTFAAPLEKRCEENERIAKGYLCVRLAADSVGGRISTTGNKPRKLEREFIIITVVVLGDG